MSKRVVIIGGGATAAAAYSRLAQGPPAGDLESVSVVSPKAVGLGQAFGTTDPRLICNTSADVTSLSATGESGLLRYLAARGWPVSRADFVPRYLVGQYCRESYAAARTSFEAQGVRTGQVRDWAQAVVPDGDGYQVELAGGDALSATDVLLCLGLDRPVLPELVSPYLGDGRLLTDAYPTSRLRASVPDDAKVLLLGTKLSAIDAALTLCTGSRRQVVMTSPSGELPAVRTGLVRPAVPLVDRARWLAVDPRDPGAGGELTRLLVAAIRRADPGIPLVAQVSGAADGQQRLAEELVLAEAGLVPWQGIVAEVIELINEWAAGWPAEERQSWLGRHRSLMSRYISAIPVRNARRLHGHFRGGRLALAAGYPQGLTPVADGWQVSWPDGRREDFTHVVCAVGYAKPRLARSASGTVWINPVLGAEPAVGADLRLRTPDGSGSERIWVLGASAHQRTAIVNYLNTAARHAAFVADQLRRPAARIPVPVTTATM